MGTWILIIAMHVHSGVNVEFQEFSSKEHCINALRVAIELGARESFSTPSATCVPK